MTFRLCSRTFQTERREKQTKEPKAASHSNSSRVTKYTFCAVEFLLKERDNEN
jgi:hypothetical protein